MSQQPWERWISADRVHELYSEGIKRYGGSGSKSKDGCVDGALGSAYSAELYTAPEVEGEFVVTGLYFSGALLFYLATRHCFIDGNKRVAWLSATATLLEMGLTLNVGEDEAVALCEEIAAGKIKESDKVIAWIAEHLVAVEEEEQH